MIDIDFDIRTAKASFDGENFMPMLVITGTNGQVTMCALAVDDPAGYLAPVLAKQITESGPIESVSFTSDVFYATDDSVPRPLDRAFAAGDPRVTEALTVTRVSRGTDPEVAIVPYLRAAGGITWGETRMLNEEGATLSGRVIDALRASLGQYKGENQ
jgi:hypothetical protein